jgi:Tol biopolymer transport system component
VNLESLNTEHHEWDPFIAPDESSLTFCSTKPGGLGRDDLYITFRDESGGWTTPVNMGDEVNSPRSENRPYVTVDGRYFFYTSGKRGNRDIYWVSASFLDQSRVTK